MKLVKISLGLAALMCLSAGFGLVAPMSSFAGLARRYGAGPEVGAPFFEYLFRLLAATAFSCGVFYAVLAWDPKKHGILVPVGGAAILFVGASAFLTGMSGRLPSMIFLMDSAGCAIVGGFIVVAWLLSRRG